MAPAHGKAGGAGPGRRGALLGLLILSACTGVSPIEATRLSQDGEQAAGRLVTEVGTARQRVERARDLLLLRAALAAPAGTSVATLRADPTVVAADARLASATAVLDQGHEALEGLRESYRAFGHVANGRDPEAFDALLDRAAEDAEALRTLIERYATDGADLFESLPGGETALGVARFAGGVVSRMRTARGLVAPNDGLIALLDELIAASEREQAVLGPLLAEVEADRGEDVLLALRGLGVARVDGTGPLETLAETYGWRVSPLADQRLREQASRRIALGLQAVAARRAAAQPAALLRPEAGRAVLVALRDRHLALREGSPRDPNALRDSLHRLAR